MSIKITDEQIDPIYNKHAKEFELDGEIQFDYIDCMNADAFVNDVINDLTKDQRKQLAEDAGLFVGEWVELDKDDESTWPRHDCYVLCKAPKASSFPVICRFFTDSFSHGKYNYTGFVTHWMPLPALEKSNELPSNH